ncbi:hypothetical protein D924_00184 [Enterococcus faecalis 06-MB-S-10]|nr:hypothetical protein D927_01339 [Enterococcus faecalis 02-MB-BW-10]EPH87526.1 hypothetical protein D924_00184 [Enterococcus faecalis 06-MB-S-10]
METVYRNTANFLCSYDYSRKPASRLIDYHASNPLAVPFTS